MDINDFNKMNECEKFRAIEQLEAALATATKLMERATQQLGTTQAVADYHDSLDEMKVWLDKQAKEDE